MLVFSYRDRSMGLMVDEIVDVVDEPLHIEITGERAGLLGTAVIAGHATDVIDTAHWLTQAFRDWFDTADDEAPADPALPHVLIVEENDFFRHMLAPLLQAGGYRVTQAAGAVEALLLREAGRRFSAIVSGVRMPGMDGHAFARKLREGGAWRDLPLIGVAGRAQARDVTRGVEAGFTDVVARADRDRLLDALRQALAVELAEAA